MNQEESGQDEVDGTKKGAHSACKDGDDTAIKEQLVICNDLAERGIPDPRNRTKQTTRDTGKWIIREVRFFVSYCIARETTCCSGSKCWSQL